MKTYNAIIQSSNSYIKGIPSYEMSDVTSDKAARFPLNSEIGEKLLKTFWVKKAFCSGNAYILIAKDEIL